MTGMKVNTKGHHCVPTVIPGLSSEADSAGTADDSAETPKPGDQSGSKAGTEKSIARFVRMRGGIYHEFGGHKINIFCK